MWSQPFNLSSDICGDDHRLRLFMILRELDFRMASRQFPSARITRNPDLPEEIVASHAVENELSAYVVAISHIYKGCVQSEPSRGLPA